MRLGEWKGWSEVQEELPGSQHLLLYPELEPEPEPPTLQIPEAPTPDVPVWNIEAFTLLDGRLVLLGGEEEVREGLWTRGRKEGKGGGIMERCLPLPRSVCLPSLSDYPLLWRSRVLASPA